MDKININALEMLFPYALANENREIIISNDAFDSAFSVKENTESRLKITDLIPEFNFNIKKQTAVIRAKCYRVFCMPDNELEKHYHIFLIENGCSQDKNCVVNKILVSLIFIDNYNEVLDTIEDVRHPLLLALVDRKLNKMARDLGGIVKNFEKDKYIFLFSEDKLEYLKETKFSILNSVREIDMGNKLPLTLSIGIGMGGSSLYQSMEFARAAIDLALSRGGDQVLIKDPERYYFYGGHSKEIGANSRVRARVKAFALTELIEEASDVIIMGHKNCDLDCLGSAVGVFSIVDAMQKKCSIVLNKVTSAISILYDRLLEKPDFMNVFINTQQALNKINDKTLLIVVDTHIPTICDAPELLENAKKIVVFDHHRKSAEFINNAVLSYHEPYASSASELITEMLLYTNKHINLTSIAADALLAGITVDTKNFALKTGTKTFEAAAYLRRNGADPVRVRTLFKSSFDLYKAKTEVVSNAEFYLKNMAISVCGKYDDNPTLLAAKAADELLYINNVEASFVLFDNGSGTSISARSLENINVQVIMEKLGGGGHQSVSAVQLKGIGIDEAIKMLKNAIDEYLKEEK